LGPEARNEKDILMLQGIKSVLVLPIIIQNRLSGFVGFDNVHAKSNWTESDRVILGIAAEFFSNIFNRKRYEKHIATSNKELNDALLNLKIAQNQLIQQEQMAAVGQLAAGIAHEINNPLTFVLSNHQMLTLYLKELIEMIDSQPACNLDDEQKSHYDFLKNDIMDVFEDMNLGIERVTKIVEGLKSFSRMDQSDVFDAYDLNDNIKHTLTIINSRIKSAAALTLDLEEDLPIIYANGSKINQVILNIIVNAIDAIEEKNSIESGALEICTKLVHDEVALIISDNGIGMSPETIQKLFNPFYTTKPIGKGTGLGMSITHEIIKNLHHGRIEVASQRQLGTTISIFLPLTHSHNNIL
jgi:C4-dicarboxylate-specific signal transduction histidine kinase